MIKIPLTQNKYALIDDEDFELVSKYNWNFTSHGYAETRTKDGLVRMHRLIMDFPKGKEVDHKNMNGIDNRRENLRICSRSQNKGNLKMYKNNKSGYKGVIWNKSLGYWIAQLNTKEKHHYLYCKSKKEAAKKYNELAVLYFGEFANLNKI